MNSEKRHEKDKVRLFCDAPTSGDWSIAIYICLTVSPYGNDGTKTMKEHTFVL